MFKKYRQYKKELKERAALANKEKRFFLNSYNTIEFWEEVVKNCNKDEDLVVEMKMADGTTVKFRTVRKNVWNKRPTFDGIE